MLNMEESRENQWNIQKMQKFLWKIVEHIWEKF